MRRTVAYAALILAAVMVATVIPTEAEGMIYEDTLRLHILANSDFEEDQRLKIKVRDALLDKYSILLSESTDTDAACREVESRLGEIEEYAKAVIKDLGYSYDVHAYIGKEWYDTRVSEDFTLPCGVYSSLRIVIGEGAGQNWWCVMYPPICTELATENSGGDNLGYTSEEMTLISGKYNVKFKFLELISVAFTKNS